MSPFPQPGPLRTFVSRPETSPSHEAAELPVIASLSGYLVATWLISLTAVMLTGTRARPPVAALTLSVAAVAVLPVIVVDLPAVPLAGAGGTLLGAIAFELVLWSTRARSARPLPPGLLPAGLIAAVWIGHLAGLALADAVRWPVSLWAGMVVLTTAAAGATGYVTGGSTRVSAPPLSEPWADRLTPETVPLRDGRHGKSE